MPFDIQKLKPEIKGWLSRRHDPWESSYLDRLICPLDTWTNPGDLLVLSPSGPLHSLPLHALALPGGQLLIERNPIVYSSSLSILRHCFLRSSAASSGVGKVLIPALMVGVYEDEGKEHTPDEIYAALEKQAQQFAGKAICGKAVTRSAMKQMEQSSLVHFYGHTEPNSDILYESLKISPERADMKGSNSNGDNVEIETLAGSTTKNELRRKRR